MIRILLVDDNADDLDITRINLAKLCKDIKIESAGSGKDALKAIDSGDHDCIVCDLDMPGMNGFELLRTLRDSGNSTPFIFFSTHDYSDLSDLTALAGAQGYQSKEEKLSGTSSNRFATPWQRAEPRV